MKDIRFHKIALPNGETIGFRHYAGGERVLVIVHGNLASSKFFDDLIETLPDSLTVYAMDLRGYGTSSNQPIDDLRDFAGDVKLFVDQLNLQKFDLLGWSMGGAISMLFASSYGYMLNRLFLVGPIPVYGYASYAVDSKGSRIQLKTRKEISQDATKLAMARALEIGDWDFYKKLWDTAIYNIKKPAPEVFDIHVAETMLQRNLLDVYYAVAKFNMTDSFNGVSMGTEEIYKIKTPTTIMHGKDDLLVSIEAVEFLQNCLGGNAQLVLWDECGHSPFVDRLEELATIIARP